MKSKKQLDIKLLDHWRKDPANWKWSVFYYNPEDKRIFPPKRNAAMGWTINFANPASVIVFSLMIVLAFVLPFIFREQIAAIF